MASTNLTQAGFRATYEYYNKLEEFHKQKAEEMRDKRMEILAEWKQWQQTVNHKTDKDA